MRAQGNEPPERDLIFALRPICRLCPPPFAGGLEAAVRCTSK